MVEKQEDLGASASPTGLSQAESQERLGPSGFDPSRVDPKKAYLLGSLDERKAVSRYLTVRAARAVYHGIELPWWAFIRRQRARWSAAGHAIAAKEIEEAAHVDDQAVWLVEINAGVVIAREAYKRDSEGAQQ